LTLVAGASLAGLPIVKNSLKALDAFWANGCSDCSTYVSRIGGRFRAAWI
jgi:hypothetical protein